MKLKELCVDERPREKMLSKGAGAMSNAELLAILIGSGTRKENVLEVANRLLAANEGKLSGIAGMDPCKMMAMDGIGKVHRRCFGTREKMLPGRSRDRKDPCLQPKGGLQDDDSVFERTRV